MVAFTCPPNLVEVAYSQAVKIAKIVGTKKAQLPLALVAEDMTQMVHVMMVVHNVVALGMEACVASVVGIEQVVARQTCLVVACLVLQAETIGYLDS